MACERRKRTGRCSHYQCPYSDETDHGYECVEIMGDFCEAGENCIAECNYSYKAGTEQAKLAEQQYKEIYEQ